MIMSKDVFILALKIIIAVASAILGILGVSSLSSCTVYRTFESTGVTRIVTIDTTNINHSGSLNINYSK